MSLASDPNYKPPQFGISLHHSSKDLNGASAQLTAHLPTGDVVVKGPKAVALRDSFATIATGKIEEALPAIQRAVYAENAQDVTTFAPNA